MKKGTIKMTTTTGSNDQLQQIIDSAQRLGIELDAQSAADWLAAVEQSAEEGKLITLDEETGVFGHRVTMLDFSTSELAHFRKIGELVGFHDQPGRVETALAISGSAAQSKIQTYPGDADYFERVNIIAPTIEEGKRILAQIMRQKALDTLSGSFYQLIEVKFGEYPFDVMRGDHTIKAGAPIAWKPEEIVAGRILAAYPDGSPAEITWDAVADKPGWCKLDWVVADTAHRTLVNASNMLDVTWEAPDGQVTPLDGYLDPYFQEVYLEAESIPVFSKLSQHVASDALDNYVGQLEKEVKKYLTKDLNYGKVAKRMYNIFRLTGRYQEAAFLRELFDEPATMLYQVWSVIRTIEDCFTPNSTITKDNLLGQVDDLILAVIKSLEGDQEVEVVRMLMRLRDAIAAQKERDEISAQVETARAEVVHIVNNFFYEKLCGMTSIKDYLDCMSATQPPC